MKSWWSNVIKNYLTFTARDRVGLLVLISLAVVFICFSRFYSVKRKPVDKTAFQRELAQLKITVDSTSHASSFKRNDHDFDYSQPKNYKDYSKPIMKGELFMFDPNTLDQQGWQRLGVKDKTIQTIQKFISKGFQFRQAEDLQKIYGLRKDEVERLMPYVRINKLEQAKNNTFGETEKPAFTKNAATELNKNSVIDINNADSAAFVALPGIGSKTSFTYHKF